MRAEPAADHRPVTAADDELSGYRYWLRAEGRSYSFSGLTPYGPFSGRRPTLRWAMRAATRHIRRTRVQSRQT